MPKLDDQVETHLAARSTEELRSIWIRRGSKEYSPEALSIVSRLLAERGEEHTADGAGDLTSATSQRAPEYAEVTRQLLASAHLNHSAIYKPLWERFGDDETARADTPEQYVDIVRLAKETRKAHNWELQKKTLLGVAGLIAVGAYGLAPDWAPLLATVVWLSEFGFDLRSSRYVRRHFSRSTFTPSEDPDPSDSEHNVIVAGGFSPFVGSGQELLAWSFVIDPFKPSDGRTPEALTPSELYEAVINALQELTIRDLKVDECLLVNGEDVARYPHLLPDAYQAPVTTITPDLVRQLRGTSHDELRHYLRIRVPAWEGQLVMTAFLRFTTIGRGIFVDAQFALLPPLKDGLRLVDRLPARLTMGHVGTMLTVAAIKAPFTVLGAWLNLATAIAEIPGRAMHDYRKDIDNAGRYNYGWQRSLRELWSTNAYQRYFQVLDKDMYLKLIQDRLLFAIERTLDAKGISTEAIRERGTTILNQGLIVTGGKVEAESLAVGQRAVAAVKQSVAKAGERLDAAKSGSVA